MMTSWLGSVLSGTTSKDAAPVNRFAVGDAVEALNLQRGWQLGCIAQIANYRGREGYYVLWTLPADAPSWVSRGGWLHGAGVRAVRR